MKSRPFSALCGALVAFVLVLLVPGAAQVKKASAGGTSSITPVELVLLWLLALLGMLWSDVGFPERLSGLAGYHKLLAIPLLLAQFRRSDRARWVIVGFFLASVGADGADASQRLARPGG